MEFVFLEDALIRGICTHASPQSKRVPNFLSSRLRQKEITHSPRHYSLEKLFSPAAERGGESYHLL